MSVSNPYLLRGLWLQDPTFQEPIGDVWQISSGFSGKHWKVNGPDLDGSSGSALRLCINGAIPGLNYLVSPYTPLGVGGGPYFTSGYGSPADNKLTFWVGIIYRTHNLPYGPSLIRALVYSYDSSGTYLDQSHEEIGWNYSNEWTFAQTSPTYFHLTAPADSTAWFKLLLMFNDSAGPMAYGKYMDIAWVGLGLHYQTGETKVDQLNTIYGAAPIISRANGSKRTSPPWAVNPRFQVFGRGASSQHVSLSLPHMDDDDRRLVEVVREWNKGTNSGAASAGMAMNADGSWDNIAVDRGSRQPGILVCDRPGLKRAMYFDIEGEHRRNPNTPGMWLEDGRWATNLTLVERV